MFSVADMSNPTTQKVMVGIARAYGKDNTTRTWRTVHRIVAAFAKG